MRTAEFSRVRDLAEQALAWSGEGAIELETGLDKTDVSPMEFSRVVMAVTAFPGASAPIETVQLDCLGASRRWEFEGEDRVRAFMRRGSSVGPAADRVLEKKQVAPTVKLTEFPFRVRLKSEKVLPSKGALVPNGEPLRMRLKRRLSVTFKDVGVRVDMTVVMETDGATGELRRARRHEIEVEALIAEGSHGSADDLAKTIMGYTQAVYCALRGTSDPISETERARFLSAYDGLTGESSTTKVTMVGPNPVTLTTDNLQPPGPGVVSITEAYTVTDKADGERRLMLLTDGFAVLMDSRGNLTRAYTGVPKSLDGTILDGELVTQGKLDDPMRLFAAFDAFWVSGRSVAALPLLGKRGERTRLAAAASVIEELTKKCVAVDGLVSKVKRFEMVTGTDWGETVERVLDDAERDLPYKIDGVIFTPAFGAVGSNYDGEAPRMRGRWSRALKWKPPSYNSVDFLVRVKRDKRTGAEILGQRQVTLPSGANVTVRSKTLVLLAGYDPYKHDSIDPLDYLTRGSAAIPRKGLFVPKVFTVPGDDTVSECVLDLTPEGRMTCEEHGEVIEDDTVVEFTFGEGGWRPLRVRHDKTERYARDGNITANDWVTAQSVYISIKNPATRAMVTGKEPAPPTPEDASVYFEDDDDDDSGRKKDRKDVKPLQAMRNFHRHVVQGGLYERYGVAGGSLLEMACGRGADISRWLKAGFSLIVGVDKANDNIVNAKGGVYSRWDRSTFKMNGRPRAAFVTLDATTRMFAPHDELKAAAAAAGQTELVNALWALPGPGADIAALEPLRGAMTRGFDLVACQFSIHYMFVDSDTLDRFIANVARMTRSGGRFVGTTFDGDLVAAGLSGKGAMSGRVGGRDVWSITRAFEGRFNGECGKAVDVFVGTIGKPAREYLVSFRTLEARMKAAGFKLEETELFKDAYRKAEAAKTLPAPLAQEEKDFSFLNRSFVFVKK
jgi:SAM-dependent methyltransferase